MYSLDHLFQKSLLSDYHVPGNVLGAGVITVSKPSFFFIFFSFLFFFCPHLTSSLVKEIE